MGEGPWLWLSYTDKSRVQARLVLGVASLQTAPAQVSLVHLPLWHNPHCHQGLNPLVMPVGPSGAHHLSKSHLPRLFSGLSRTVMLAEPSFCCPHPSISPPPRCGGLEEPQADPRMAAALLSDPQPHVEPSIIFPCRD